MQTVPNWQAMAQNYYFSANGGFDTMKQMHLNRFCTPANVHFQKEGVVSYHRALRKALPDDARGRLRARQLAEAEFGQFLIGIV